MKVKTFIAVAAAAAAGYIIAKNKTQKEVVRRLVEQNAFENNNEKI